jgi:hypothetical protein
VNISIRSGGFKLVCSLYCLLLWVIGYVARDTNPFSILLVKTVELAIAVVAMEGPRTRTITDKAGNKVRVVACSGLKT